MRVIRRIVAAALAVSMALGMSGCMENREPVAWRLSSSGESRPEIPEKLGIGEDGLPLLTVYDVSSQSLTRLDVETYIEGVVAGEMKNDWPLEALKAQAILARTFVLRFCRDKSSKYGGADISTDVSEAQAYARDSVNRRVSRAVEETRGKVMAYGGELANAWFHAHSGGMTELPSVALEYRGGDPEYLKPTASRESDKAPEDAKAWFAAFDADQVAKACAEAGVEVGEVRSVALGERGESGRVKALIVNDKPVSAPSFRIHIGANRLRSTLIDEMELKDGQVVFRGRGFGHGVGLSQWGAYGMAEEGVPAARIVEHYFPGTRIVRLW